MYVSAARPFTNTCRPMPPTCSCTFLPFSFASNIDDPVPVGTTSASTFAPEFFEATTGTASSIMSPARDTRLVQPFSKRTRTIPESIARLSRTPITSPTASEPRAAESSSTVSRIVAFFTALYSPRSPVSSGCSVLNAIFTQSTFFGFSEPSSAPMSIPPSAASSSASFSAFPFPESTSELSD